MQRDTDFTAILNQFAGKRIIVLGDVMLDRDIIGPSFRRSPEADVPVILNPRIEERLGGAGAVAAMCAAFGATVDLIGVTDSRKYRQIRDQCMKAGVSPEVPSSIHVATVKERIWIETKDGRQQVARIDREEPGRIDMSTEDLLGRAIGNKLSLNPDIVIVSDYFKGVCTGRVVAALADVHDQVIVDPPRGQSWDKYRGVSCLVPNAIEARGRLAFRIRHEFETEAVIVKQGDCGCLLSEKTYDPLTPLLVARKSTELDPCGAGDQFIATLALARAAGGDWIQSAQLANIAAGMQVERYGCVPVTFAELQQEISRDCQPEGMPRLCGANEAG